MKGFLKLVIGIFAGALLLLIVAFASLGFIVYNEAQSLEKTKVFIEQTLSENLKLNAKLEHISVDWQKLLKFQPSLSIKSISLANPPGFNSPYLAEISSLSLEVDLLPLLKKEISIKKVILNKPKITFEENQSRQVNIDRWLKRMLVSSPRPKSAPSSKAPAKEKSDLEKKVAKAQKDFEKEANKKLEEAFQMDKLSLDNFLLANGSVKYMDYSKGKVKELFDLHSLNIKSNNFATDRSSPVSMDFKLFKAKAETFVFNGRVGPFSPSAIPADGFLDLKILFSEIPKNLRKKFAGNLVLEPRDNDKFLANSSVKGDLLKSLSGNGSIYLDRIRMGKSKKRKVIVESTIPFNYRVNNLLAIPSAYLNINKCNIAIDKDSNLAMNMNLSYLNEITSGAVSGSLSGLEINNLISSFTPNEDFVYGKFQIPNFNFKFSGADEVQIFKSLVGSGSLNLEDGHIPMLGLVYKAREIIAIIAKKSKLDQDDKDMTKFASLSTDFQVANEKFITPNLLAHTPLGKIKGSGHVKFDQRMNYDFIFKVLERNIPVEIKGTTEKPKVKVDFASVLKDEVQDKFGSQLEKLLGIEKKKPENAAPIAETTQESDIVRTQPAGITSPEPTKKKKKKKPLDSLLDLGKKELLDALN